MTKKKPSPVRELAQRLRDVTSRPYTACLIQVKEYRLAHGRLPFVPPAHYQRGDGSACCVHLIPVGVDSCGECRDLAEVKTR